MSHPLDNVIWEALTTRQASFAESTGLARRFPGEVTSLGAFSEPTPAAYESLARLLGADGRTALFLDDPVEPLGGLALLHTAPLVQMLHDGNSGPARATEAALLVLTSADVPEMVELAELTKPGPFGKRTRELGTYLGIRHGTVLAAMAGERLKLPGYTEVSAVCTHPDHLGHGYATTLIAALVTRIQKRGETAFLHSRADNDRAIGVYERLGFKTRRNFRLAVLGRNTSGN